MTGTNEKIKCIQKYASEFPIVKTLLRMTYDPYITYGIKKIPAADEGDLDIDQDELIALLHKLAKRELTGNSAREELMRIKSGKRDNWIIDRIIGRDLKVNISVKSINKAVKNLIPVFNIALCERLETESQIPEGYNVAQVKIDGTRNIAIVDIENQTVEHYSRAGIRIKQFDNMARLNAGLLELADEIIKEKCLYRDGRNDSAKIVFDGEISGGSWSKTINAKASVNENIEAKEKLIYYIFDYVPFDIWQTGVESDEMPTLIERSDNLVKLIFRNMYVHEYIVFPYSLRSDKKTELIDFYHECLEMGYEGIVIKKEDSYYNFKKSKDWLKLKPVMDFDGKIEKVIEGTGKYSGMLGAILVSGKTENDQEFYTKIGTGFDDNQRKEYWECRDSLIGRTVEFEGQELTDPDSKTGIYSVRFPSFKCFRLDK